MIITAAVSPGAVKVRFATPHLSVWENTFSVDLLTHDGTCRGALVWNGQHGKTLVWAKQTVLASGGGTSVEALDDLCILGGKPAVFTEYSGNPTAEKVKGLTKIALMHPGPIHAIWVIGGRANFTDIYETLIGGIMGGIRAAPNFDKTIPILIRRAGPRDEEAFAQLNKIQNQEGYRFFLRGMATSVASR